MHEINQLILFHPQKFVCRSFEKFGKDMQINVYSLDSAEEFAYLVDELSPQFLLIHEDLYFSHTEFFQTELAKAKFSPSKIVLISRTNQLANLPQQAPFNAQILEPYDIGDLDNILQALLAEHH